MFADGQSDQTYYSEHSGGGIETLSNIQKWHRHLLIATICCPTTRVPQGVRWCRRGSWNGLGGGDSLNWKTESENEQSSSCFWHIDLAKFPFHVFRLILNPESWSQELIRQILRISPHASFPQFSKWSMFEFVRFPKIYVWEMVRFLSLNYFEAIGGIKVETNRFWETWTCPKIWRSWRSWVFGFPQSEVQKIDQNEAE